MSRCCINVGDLGCYDCSLENIDTGLIATVTGIHKIEVFFHSIKLTQEINITLGNPIIFPNRFNENYTFELKIIDPNGDEFTDSGNDCWKFTTQIDNAV